MVDDTPFFHDQRKLADEDVPLLDELHELVRDFGRKHLGMLDEVETGEHGDAQSLRCGGVRLGHQPSSMGLFHDHTLGTREKPMSAGEK